MDSPLRARNQTVENAMEASIISCSGEIQDATVDREVDVGRLLGISRAYSRYLSGTTVTSATYCDVLQRELKTAIRSKRRGKLSKEILLLHDNARPPPHTAAHILETLKQLNLLAPELFF